MGLFDCSTVVTGSGWSTALADFGGGSAQACGYEADVSALWVLVAPYHPYAFYPYKVGGGSILAVAPCSAVAVTVCSKGAIPLSFWAFTVYRFPDPSGAVSLEPYQADPPDPVLYFVNGLCGPIGFDFASGSWYQLVQDPTTEQAHIVAGAPPKGAAYNETVSETAAAAVASPFPPSVNRVCRQMSGG